ncbi:hypothetical protein LJR038_002057 [Acidovorax sp. LjRoot38]|uniref:hypothetical protein n=1 Tax=Acidovorax sp. LjRoot38 TaxID=3342327 RepID=UPI003ED0042B
MPHALNWFEIPVTDFTRAKTFYETVLGITIAPMEMGPTKMGMLSTDPTAAGGAIVQGEAVCRRRTGRWCISMAERTWPRCWRA